MSESESDALSTTGSESEESSGSESESQGEQKTNLEDTAASAREQFKQLTAETDKKNAALERRRDSDSSDNGNARGGNEGKMADASGSESDSSMSSTSTAQSPKHSVSGSPSRGLSGGEGSRMVTGQHHDEELEMSSDTIDTAVYNQQLKRNAAGQNKSALPTTASASSDSESSSSSDDDMSAPGQSRDDMPTNEYEGMESADKLGSPLSSPGRSPKAELSSIAKSSTAKKGGANDSDLSESDSDSSDSDSSDSAQSPTRGKDYSNLRVSAEIKSLFEYVRAYDPSEHQPELPTLLKPFIPEYIPSIGVPDVFVKMPRPDGEPETAGLTALDEPAANQTDRNIFEMQLRSQSKVRMRNDKETAVPCIENAEKKTETVQQWITNVEELHSSRPAPSVVYSHAMPDIDDSMRVWPAEFEAFLAQNDIKFSADLDVDVCEFARICCALMDIPVHKGTVTESLHHFFTLWSAFRENQHFQVTNTGLSGGVLDDTDYRLSTPEAIEAALLQSDHRPTTAEGIRQAMENSLADQRPSTSTHLKDITGNYRPDTAAAIAAVQQLEQKETIGK